MIFQSVGSQHDLVDSLKHLVSLGGEATRTRLTRHLSRHYQGEAAVFTKGRNALSEAVRIATGGKGKVAISGFTCYVVVQAVREAGCDVVYLDIEKSDLNFSAASLEEAIKDDAEIRAVIVQNTLGIPCDIAAIERVTDQHNLYLIEDLAHCVGATYDDGREVGKVGDMTMLSFGRDKLLDTVSGGALIVRNPELRVQLRQPYADALWRDQLRDRVYPILMWLVRVSYGVGIGRYIMAGASMIGLITRSGDGKIDRESVMPGWQAARVLDRLHYAKNDRRRRLELTRTYQRAFGDDFLLVGVDDNAAPVRLGLMVKNRARIIAKLREAGMMLEDIWYDSPVGPKKLYPKAGFPEDKCPNAVAVSHEIINLPTHRYVTDEVVKQIAEIIKREAAV